MFRTLLFIPGNNKRFLEKSKFLYPDILCFDLEDSVPTSEKTIARDMIIEYFCSDQGSNHVDIKNNNNNNANYKDKESSQIFVRINSFESEIYEQDLESIICERLDGIVLPKVNSPSELEKITKIITNLEKKRNIEKKIMLIPSIESSQGVVNSYHIAKFNERICSLVFGVFDYLYDMKLDYENNG
jgi:citrate lyase subunit beta / citryl-CoA lyase